MRFAICSPILILIAACGSSVIEDDSAQSNLIGVYRVENSLANAGSCSRDVVRPTLTPSPMFVVKKGSVTAGRLIVVPCSDIVRCDQVLADDSSTVDAMFSMGDDAIGWSGDKVSAMPSVIARGQCSTSVDRYALRSLGESNIEVETRHYEGLHPANGDGSCETSVDAVRVVAIDVNCHSLTIRRGTRDLAVPQ